MTIWETQDAFKKALSEVKEKILIESPWIKRATKQYIPLFEKILEEGKRIIILYGIKEKDEHDITTLKELETLQRKYDSLFTLIHLPDHLCKSCLPFTGSHRKLVIKDNDYYITGSFNFLSFSKKRGERVANEESMFITENVDKKWNDVKESYKLKI